MNRYIFTIRELVLLTLVVAMGVAWWVDRSQLSEQNRSLRDEQRILRFEAIRAQKLAGKLGEWVYVGAELRQVANVEPVVPSRSGPNFNPHTIGPLAKWTTP